MDVAFVEDAEHDVDGDDRGQDQPELVRERRAEGERRRVERTAAPGGGAE